MATNDRKKIASGQINLRTDDTPSQGSQSVTQSAKKQSSDQTSTVKSNSVTSNKFPPTSNLATNTTPTSSATTSVTPAPYPAPMTSPQTNLLNPVQSTYGSSDWNVPPMSASPWQVQNNLSSQNKPLNMDEKVEIIKKIYIEVLGRDAETKDINYHKYGIVDEDSMRRKLTQTNEHKDIIQKGREFQKIKELYDSTLAKSKMYESKIRDHIDEFKKLQEMLDEKNRYIQGLRTTPTSAGQQVFTSQQQPSLGVQPASQTLAEPSSQPTININPQQNTIQNQSLIQGIIDFIKSLFNF